MWAGALWCAVKAYCAMCLQLKHQLLWAAQIPDDWRDVLAAVLRLWLPALAASCQNARRRRRRRQDSRRCGLALALCAPVANERGDGGQAGTVQLRAPLIGGVAHAVGGAGGGAAGAEAIANGWDHAVTNQGVRQGDVASDVLLQAGQERQDAASLEQTVAPSRPPQCKPGRATGREGPWVHVNCCGCCTDRDNRAGWQAG